MQAEADTQATVTQAKIKLWHRLGLFAMISVSFTFALVACIEYGGTAAMAGLAAVAAAATWLVFLLLLYAAIMRLISQREFYRQTF